MYGMTDVIQGLEKEVADLREELERYKALAADASIYLGAIVDGTTIHGWQERYRLLAKT